MKRTYRDRTLYKYSIKFEHITQRTITKQAYRRYARILAKWFALFPDFEYPDEVTKFERFAFVDSEIAKGITQGSARREALVLKFFWDWMIGQGIAIRNPFERIKPPPKLPKWQRQ